jgi:hypothetical protein
MLDAFNVLNNQLVTTGCPEFINVQSIDQRELLATNVGQQFRVIERYTIDRLCAAHGPYSQLEMPLAHNSLVDQFETPIKCRLREALPPGRCVTQGFRH